MKATVKLSYLKDRFLGGNLSHCIAFSLVSLYIYLSFIIVKKEIKEKHEGARVF